MAAAHVPDQRKLLEAGKAFLEIGAEFLHVLAEAIALHDLDILERCGTAHRVSGVGKAVREAGLVVFVALQLCKETIRDQQGTQWHVTGRQALGAGNHVDCFRIREVEIYLVEPGF